MDCSICGKPTVGNESICEDCRTVRETAATTEQASASGSKQMNEYVEKSKDLSKAYWSFFVTSVKAPTATGENAGKSQLVNGGLNFFFLSLFAGLGIYFELKKFGGGLSFIGMDVSFKTFLTVFLYMAIASLFSALVLFLTMMVLMKADVTYQTVLARFGALSTVPTAFSALFFLFSLTTAFSLSSLFSLFMLIGLELAIVVTFYSFQKGFRAKFDPLYGLLIYHAIFMLFLWITRGYLPNLFVGSLF